ncbi:MAG TPA: hypothetical protein VL919_02980, partial [Vicinamibacterales bacterium]|nr:hypothetical protein [Vicinamibacterales bacterium]
TNLALKSESFGGRELRRRLIRGDRPGVSQLKYFKLSMISRHATEGAVAEPTLYCYGLCGKNEIRLRSNLEEVEESAI